jgi:23S rRNA 5-hydroxycytidine C2501 synthase
MPEKARFLEEVGFSQVVLARELSVDEIREVRKATTVPLECFIHGALCVSYSGRCHASCALRGRSANRGECAQLCRLPYNLTDRHGNTLFEQKHLLSLRDFNQADRLEALLDAGASSLKIEGRLKDIPYVKNVTAYYNSLLNDICERHPERYQRRAVGKVHLNFKPDVAKSFNRGFTHYFFDGRDAAKRMSSPDTPKSIGEPLGKVKSVRGNSIIVDTKKMSPTAMV